MADSEVGILLKVRSDDAAVKTSALKFTELESKVKLAQQAFTAIKKVVSETVGTFTTYAKTVEDMARVTGSGAEETSRLIQVADDLQISATDLSTALAGAVRKGINPSVDSIAALSDEYLKLQPGLEQSKFLMDNFGRSGLAMARLMEQGGDSIREMGAAVDDSLVMTEDGIKAAQDYALALDTLNDRVEGAKIAIGSQLVPVLTDAATATELLFNWQDKLNQISADATTNAEQTATTYKDYAMQAIAAAAATGQLDDRQQRIAQSLLDGTMPAEKAAEYTNELAGALDLTDQKTWNAEQSTTDWMEALDGTAQIADIAAVSIGGYNAAITDADAQARILNSAMQDLTKELIFNAAAENLSADEAIKLGLQMGVLNTDTVGAMTQMEILNEKLANGEITTLEYRTAVTNLGLSLDALAEHPYDIMANFTVNREDLDQLMRDLAQMQGGNLSMGGGGGGEIIEARAAGGPVNAGQPYLVGENGPEIITPNRDAYVVPNGAGNVYNFYGYNNPTAIAQRLAVLEAFGV